MQQSLVTNTKASYQNNFSMEGVKERTKLSGKNISATTAFTTSQQHHQLQDQQQMFVTSPSNNLNNTQQHHSNNVVIQTGTNLIYKQNRNETDLQKAITDYQGKTNKHKQGKNKNHSSARGMGKNSGNDSAKYGPLSQKKLADTYMVGGCSMDLNNTYSSQKKATILFNQNAGGNYSTKQASGTGAMSTNHHSSQHHNNISSSQKNSTHQRSRPSNMNQKAERGNISGPMQLEPNPVFSIIEEQMEKMNRRTQEREEAHGINHKEISYVDGSNVMQLQKMAMQSSFEGRILDSVETYNNGADDDQVVAYSSKRKNLKNHHASKSVAKKSNTSPKNSAFFNNSTVGEMSNIWQKYRRNMHEAKQKTSDIGGLVVNSGRAGKAHSMSRQDYLIQQHKMNQQAALQQMQDKVNQYQKKVINEQLHDSFTIPSNNKNKERFSKSIGRELNVIQSRGSKATFDSTMQSNFQSKNQQSKALNSTSTDVATENKESVQNPLDIDTQEHQMSGDRDTEQPSALKENSQILVKDKNGSKMQQSAKGSALNGKVSTSIKATWTVNRSSYGQPASRLHNSSLTNEILNEALESQNSQEFQQLNTGDSDRQKNNSSLKVAESKQPKTDQRTSTFQRNSEIPQTQKTQQYQQKQLLSPSSKIANGNQISMSSKSRFEPSSNVNRKKTPTMSNYQQVVSSTNQASQLANRRRFLGGGAPGVQTQKKGNQEVITAPVSVKTFGLQNENSAGDKGAINKEDTAEAMSPAYSPGKKPRKKSKHFEQLMNAGSAHHGANTRLSPTKQQTENQNAYDEEQKLQINSQQQSAQKPKEFFYQDPGVKIGQGKFGPVNLIIHQGKLFAQKIIPKESIDKTKRIEHVKNEKHILHMLRKNQMDEIVLDSGASQRINAHRSNKREEQNSELGEKEDKPFYHDKLPLEFIVMLLETFVDDKNVNFVFEYLPGQDLFWILQNENNLNLGQNQRRRDWVLFYSAELLCALDTLHQRQIIYRDMKPDNVMIDYEGHIKLIDFGFAKKLYERTNFRTKTNCGTIGYTPPEILMGTSQGYSFQVDIWSFGIMIAELLSGSLPFQEKEDPMKINEQILAGQIKLMKQGIDMIARDFLKDIFQGDPEMRPSIEQLQKHRLFMEMKPADYWQQIQAKTFQEVPYKPNPLRYAYLLQNEYPTISNLQKPPPKKEATLTNTPVGGEGGQDPQLSPVGQEQVNERNVSPAPSFGGLVDQNPSTISKAEIQPPQPKSAAIDLKALMAKPSNMERDMNVGMFGRGGGAFDASGNVKNSPLMYGPSPEVSPSLRKRKPNTLLGDFTQYRVNKEFENF